MKLVVSSFAALLLLAVVGQAAPYEAKNVAADAKWVAHVDIDAVRDSQIVKKAFATCPLLKSGAGKHFDKIQKEIGVDLRKDLHGVTLYGPDTDKLHAVAIVFAKTNQKLLLEKAARAPDHKVTRHGKIEIHSWTGKCGPKTHAAAGAFYKGDILVFAADAKRVAAAIDVLDGKSPGITNPESPLGGRLYPGSTVILRAIAIRPETRCPILKQAESFRIAMGEHEGKSFYRARIAMKSKEGAEQVKAMTEGLKAVASLKFAKEGDVMKLVNGLQTSVEENTVRIQWDASTDDVWAMIEKVAKKAGEHFKKAGGCPLAKGKGKDGCPLAGKDGKPGKCPLADKDGKGECPHAKKDAAPGKCPGCKGEAKCPGCKAKAKAKAEGKDNDESKGEAKPKPEGKGPAKRERTHKS